MRRCGSNAGVTKREKAADNSDTELLQRTLEDSGHQSEFKETPVSMVLCFSSFIFRGSHQGAVELSGVRILPGNAVQGKGARERLK